MVAGPEESHPSKITLTEDKAEIDRLAAFFQRNTLKISAWAKPRFLFLQIADPELAPMGGSPAGRHCRASFMVRSRHPEHRTSCKAAGSLESPQGPAEEKNSRKIFSYPLLATRVYPLSSGTLRRAAINVTGCTIAAELWAKIVRRWPSPFNPYGGDES